MNPSAYDRSARYTIWRALVALLTIIVLSTATVGHTLAAFDPTFAIEMVQAGDHHAPKATADGHAATHGEHSHEQAVLAVVIGQWPTVALHYSLPRLLQPSSSPLAIPHRPPTA